MPNPLPALVLLALACGGSTPVEPATHADRLGLGPRAGCHDSPDLPIEAAELPAAPGGRPTHLGGLWAETWGGADKAPPFLSSIS
jgi:hypothetical protein